MNIIRSIKKNEFLKSVFSVGAGNLLAQIINIITIPIISRLYTDEVYGEFGIFTSTATIIVGITTLGLNSSIMLPKEDSEAKKVLTMTFYIQLFLTSFIMIGCILIMPYYRFFEVSFSYAMTLMIMGGYVILTNLNSLLITYTNRRGMNKVLFINPIIGAISKLVITLPFGIIHMGIIGFIGASILSLICTCTQMIKRTEPFWFEINLKDIKNLFISYKKFILFQYPANFISQFAVQLPVQIFSRIFGNAQVGSYTMCVRLLQYPAILIAAPIGTVYFRTASRYNRNGENISDFTYKLISKIMWISLIPSIIVIVFGERIFTFLLGNQWREAGILASILVVQYVLQFCATCTSYCRVTIGRQNINLYYSIIQILIISLFIWRGFSSSGSFVGTIIWFSIGMSIVLIVDMGLNFYCLKKNFLRYLKFISIYFLIIGGVFAVMIL